jgi:hypothetical protein
MPFTVEPEMLIRSRANIHAAERLFLNAESVAQACGEAGPREVVFAVVDRFGTFIGCWTVPLERAHEVDHSMSEDDWRVLFPSGASRADVEERAIALGRLAMQRWEALLRWTSHHGGMPPGLD